MSELLVRIRSELDDRIAVLKPVAEEFNRLQAAIEALDHVAVNGATARSSTAVAPAPAPATVRAKPARRRRATRSGSARAAPGQTQQRVIDQLHSGPGSTSTAVAAALGISANAAAATISRLVKQGRVRRLETGGYGAAGAPGGPAAAEPPPPATDAAS